jgi:succinate dehydrogenase hydrophobic anchor subunit
MTAGNDRPMGRFLGRPAGADPGFVPPDEQRDLHGLDGTGQRKTSRAGRLWLGQAVTGGLLLVFLAVHLVAQHLLAPEGLRDHAAVLDYLRQPVALAAEIGLLASVIAHASLGMRSSLVDVLGTSGLRRASGVIAAIGIAAFAYGAWLTVTILT